MTGDSINLRMVAPDDDGPTPDGWMSLAEWAAEQKAENRRKAQATVDALVADLDRTIDVQVAELERRLLNERQH